MGVKVLTRMAVIIWISVYWKTMKKRFGYTRNPPSEASCCIPVNMTIIIDGIDAAELGHETQGTAKRGG